MRSIICYRDTDLDGVTLPQFVRASKEEICRDLYQGIVKLFKEEEIADYKNKELLYLGEFDELTGQIIAKLPETIFICNEALAARARRLAEEKHVDGEVK